MIRLFKTTLSDGTMISKKEAKRLIGSRGGLKLNLGCGRMTVSGFINSDMYMVEGIDMVIDLNDKLPFDDNSVDVILASHVIEHLEKWRPFIYEAHRVLKPGGIIEIRVPYGFEPQTFHDWYFLPHTMDYLCTNKCVDGCVGLQYQERPFHQIMCWRTRRTPFRWHLNKYLGIDVPIRDGGLKWSPFRLGRYYEIRWLLEAVK